MPYAPSAPPCAPGAPGAAPALAEAGEARSFEDLYDLYFDFAWRNLRRLGVPEALLDDAAQEVFLVVHRRLAELDERGALKQWIFGIVLRVARDTRRWLKRKSPHTQHAGAQVEADSIADDRCNGPDERTERSEAARMLHKLLDVLDDEKRAVFVLAELEQMTAPEIAEALGVNVNTVYARLRAARREFEQAALREQARDGWRLR
jgi:RNA polymerase sigma-70 factor (ECF subfamily)